MAIMRANLTPMWTVIIVPPKLDAAPRRLGVKKRTVRRVLLLAAIVAIAPWALTFVASDSAGQMADQLAETQRVAAALQDTVQSVRLAAAIEQAKKLPPVGMLMPLNGEITSRFSRARFHPILQVLRAHKGVDIAAPYGTQISAPADGLVRSVGRRLGYGLTIEIVHTGGVVTRYAHLQAALIQRGDSVSKGQAIGKVGSSGLATGPHLHFELLFKGESVDPIRFIAATHLAPPGVAAH